MPITITELLERVNRPIEVKIGGGGKLQLKPFDYEQVAPLKELLSRELTDRELAAHVIHHQLKSPELIVEELQGWPTRRLGHVLAMWSKDERGLDRTLPASHPRLASFRRVLIEKVNEDPYKGIKEAMKSMGSMGFMDSVLGSSALDFASSTFVTSSLIRANEYITGLSRTGITSVVNQIGEEKHRMLGVMGTDFSFPLGQVWESVELARTAGLFDAASSLMETQRSTIEHFLQPGISELLGVQLARPQFTGLLAENNALIGGMLADLDGIAAAPSTLLMKRFVGPLADLTGVYDAYLKDTMDGLAGAMHADAKSLMSLDRLNLELTLPTTASALLVRTIRHAVQPLHELHGEETDYITRPHIQPHVQPYSQIDADQAESRDWRNKAEIRSVEVQLATVDYHLAAVWIGGWQALYSDNPHRFAHVATSGRELISQVLRKLAPSEAFTKEDIKLYGEGSNTPTRAMRLKYIFGIEQTQSSSLVEKWIRLANEVYSSFSNETHNDEATARFTERDLAGLLLAAGTIASYVLGISRLK